MTDPDFGLASPCGPVDSSRTMRWAVSPISLFLAYGAGKALVRTYSWLFRYFFPHLVYRVFLGLAGFGMLGSRVPRSDFRAWPFPVGRKLGDAVLDGGALRPG